jgi:prepilin-type N-terminal cleavage/methylation domain-containing protein
MTRHARRRGGFTLIELLVTIAIIVGLMGMTMMFSVWSLDRNRAAAAVNQLTGAANIARTRAHRDGLPHGIRLIDNGNRLATTAQYIQSPAVFLASAPGALPGPTHVASPYLQFEYTLDGVGQVPAAANNPRQCRIYGLNADQQSQFTVNSLLYLPTIGTWHRITGVSGVGTNPLTVSLDEYPDAQLGAATHWRTYHFGLYGPPRALLGEEVMQLPEYSCVDLNPGRSVPAGNGSPHYDILFAPNGRLVSVPPPSPNTGAVGHVFWWVRDPTRPDNFNDGGEQLLVVIKAQSGAVGSAPIDRPPATDPYFLARKAVAGH